MYEFTYIRLCLELLINFEFEFINSLAEYFMLLANQK